jgi:diguanylate cyclase (GGDEF)-like protein
VNREQQALLELIQRTKRGTFLHLPIWMLMGICVAMPAVDARTYWINCAGFAVSTALRIVFYRGSKLVERHPDAARQLLRILIFAPCLQWSLLATAGALPGPLHVLMLPLLLMVVGLATAGTVVLAVDGLVRIWFPIFALVPVGFGTLLAQPRPMGLLLALMDVLTIVYVAAATRVVHDDYWASLDARALLEERARALETLSTTDALTQIPNRLHFERCLEEAWAQAALEQKPLSVLLVDLDHFKSINDTHGHSFGDDCIKAAARALRGGLLRETDLVARWGGEEFVVLLPHTDSDGAQDIAQRLLGGIAGTVIPSPDGTIRLACSIGVASRYPDARARPKSLINEADRALYEAKNQGRNRVAAAAA